MVAHFTVIVVSKLELCEQRRWRRKLTCVTEAACKKKRVLFPCSRHRPTQSGGRQIKQRTSNGVHLYRWLDRPAWPQSSPTDWFDVNDGTNRRRRIAISHALHPATDLRGCSVIPINARTAVILCAFWNLDQCITGCSALLRERLKVK